MAISEELRAESAIESALFLIVAVLSLIRSVDADVSSMDAASSCEVAELSALAESILNVISERVSACSSRLLEVSLILPTISLRFCSISPMATAMIPVSSLFFSIFSRSPLMVKLRSPTCLITPVRIRIGLVMPAAAMILNPKRTRPRTVDSMILAFLTVLISAMTSFSLATITATHLVEDIT